MSTNGSCTFTFDQPSDKWTCDDSGCAGGSSCAAPFTSGGSTVSTSQLNSMIDTFNASLPHNSPDIIPPVATPSNGETVTIPCA